MWAVSPYVLKRSRQVANPAGKRGIIPLLGVRGRNIKITKAAERSRRGVVQQAILSHALLTCWHQTLDFRQRVATDNANAILVGRQDLVGGTVCRLGIDAADIDV